jgi:DNA topoisomerase-1
MRLDFPEGLPKNYVLVIAEKPRAAEKIALALGKPVKRYINGVPIWVLRKGNEFYIVASAVGHMYSLATDEKGYPVFNYKWVPRYIIEKRSKHVKQFLDVLALLSKYAKLYISACDYDIEGSVICYMILKHHGDERKALRAKFSSLVRQEIVKAFENLSKLDYEMIEAGICRHVLDWLWGINISRALMDIYAKSFNIRRILSAGRVQTPTLAYAVDTLIERRLFVPRPLAYPSIYVKIGEKVYHLELLDPPFNSASDAKSYIEKVREIPRAVVESVSVNVVEYNPPHPFNLPDLQAEAYRILKLSPYRTQKLAEDLYLEALISYPRTNSQKLPPELNNKQILEKLAENPAYKPFVEELLKETRGILKPNNGEKDDPAHPAIHPTGESTTKKLSAIHLKLYDLIVRRYIATFAKPMKVQFVNIVFNIHGKRYALKGSRILEKGWSKYYPYMAVEEKYIPVDMFAKGKVVPIEKIGLVIRYTKPPQLPTRLTLLKWMEEVEIGTEATRAEIIETLFKRGYIYTSSRSINVSDLAIAIVYILRKYVKDLVRVDLTREFERMLKDIVMRKTSCRDIEQKAKDVVSRYIRELKSNLNNIVQEFCQYVEPDDDIKLSSDKRCAICRRALYKDGLCLFHYEALKRIRETYMEWQKFNLSWRKYLERLLKLKSTGLYVKDVCKYLLKFGNTVKLQL